jgi:hypothetical protein
MNGLQIVIKGKLKQAYGELAEDISHIVMVMKTNSWETANETWAKRRRLSPARSMTTPFRR